jgi:uncharacterized paraquat-inducible protein A
MIKIDFVLALSWFLILSLCLVFALWLFYTCHRENTHWEDEEIQQCPFCTHVFPKIAEGKHSQCPQCKSYLTIEQTLNKPV